MSKFLLPALALFVFTTVTSGADTPDGSKTKPYPLKTCIVSDEKLDEDTVTKVYDDQEIKFCCKKCIKEFEADKAKFMKKIDGDQPHDAKTDERHHDK